MNAPKTLGAVVAIALVTASAPPTRAQTQDPWVVTQARPIGSLEHQLDVARRIMRRPREYSFGPWRLLAEDSLRAGTRKSIEAVASSLAESYERRFKVEPRVTEAWFLLFDDEDEYRRFRSQFGSRLTGATEGHATDRLAATFVGKHTRDHVTALVVHEGVHLLNRATFGDRLPVWLDEGLATSLSYNRVDADGRLLLGTISSRSLSTSRSEQLPDGRRRTTHKIRLEGPMAALLAYSERPREWPPLSALTGAWGGHNERQLERIYPQAGFLVRFLFDGADRDTQLAFRALLAELAARPRPALITALENRLPELEPAFRNWLDRLARNSLDQLQPPMQPPPPSR